MKIKSKVNGQTCVFTIPKQEASLAKPIVLTTPQQANDSGAPLFIPLLKLNGFQSVAISTKKKNCKVAITLEGREWGDVFGNSGKTLQEFIKDGLTKKIIDENVPAISIEDKAHLKASFIKAIQKSLDEFSSKKIIGSGQGKEKESINDHGGKITAMSYSAEDKKLTIKFSGACVTTCASDHGDAALTGTQQMVTNMLSQKYPNAFNLSKMSFVNAG